MATIKENRVNGKLISFKFTSCLGRDAQGKQIRRYTTWKVPEGMTPSKAKKLAEREAKAWEASLRAELMEEEKTTVEVQKKKEAATQTNFLEYVREIWFPLCIESGEYKPKTSKPYNEKQHAIYSMRAVFRYAPSRVSMAPRMLMPNITNIAKPKTAFFAKSSLLS